MRLAECQRVFDLERTYWWFVGTRELIYSTLVDSGWTRSAKRVLDVGCGSGIMLDKLRSTPDPTECLGVDIVPECAAYCRDKGHTLVCRAGAEHLPFPDGYFDLLVSTDVLEHCADDVAVLGEFRRVLAPGGRLLLSVPAFEMLWSQHDVALDHYRRYRSRPLASLIAGSGFRVHRTSYFNSFLFPPLVVVRILQRLLPTRGGSPRAEYPAVPAWANHLLIGLCGLEARLLRWLRLPFGTSVLVLASVDETDPTVTS
jgi:SAM-dependent methyltransferase